MSMLLLVLKGAIVLATALLAWLLLHRASASTRRMVIAAGIIGSVSLPLLTTLLPSLDVRALQVVNGFEAAAEVVLAPIDEMLSPASVEQGVQGEVASSAGVLGGVETAAAPASATGGSSVSAPHRSGVASRLGSFALLAWLVVMVVLLGRLLIGLALTMRMRRVCSDDVPSSWRASLEEASNVLHLSTRGVELRFTNAVEVPTVAGIFRPTIFLPLDASKWRRRRRRFVLLHELAHVMHHDNLLVFLGQVLCAVHWFNPLAWWAVRCLAVESERAADDVVLEVGTKATDYASELVRIVRDRQLGIVAASTMAKPAELTTRVRWILDPRCRREGWSPGQRAAFWTMGLAVLVFLSCARGSISDVDDYRLASSSLEDSTEVLTRMVAESYGVLPDGVELTIDEPLQGVVDAEVQTLVDRYGARSVSVVAIDPCSGHVLALGGHGAGGLTNAVRAQEPGATLAPLTIAAALEEGMSPQARTYCENGAWRIGDRTIRDATPSGWLDVRAVVTRSSSIGTGRIYQEELGWDVLRSRLVSYGLGERPEIHLPGAEAGEIPRAERSSLHGVLAANGIGLRTSSIQLASAYAALANDGVYHAPSLVRRVRDETGTVIFDHRSEDRRMMSESTADTVLSMLEDSVESDEGSSRLARVDGFRIAGMTGTTQLPPNEGETTTDFEFSASFVGIVEPEEPQVVIVVGVEGLRGENVTGGQVAAPAFARIVSRAREVSSRVE